jgi:Gluconate 2-dehydrogenase subunit 3
MERREALKKTLLALGYTISVPSLISIFNSCNSHSSQKWQPQFFSSDQATVIGELAETILPKTKTPGAKDLNIDQFIDRMIKQVFSAEDQQFFLKGMEAFEKECRDINGRSFIECSPDQRNELLQKLEQKSTKTPPSVWGIDLKDAGPMPFYRKTKELTLLGYFTSEQVGKKILVYDPVPGFYAGDIPLSDVVNISFE